MVAAWEGSSRKPVRQATFRRQNVTSDSLLCVLFLGPQCSMRTPTLDHFFRQGSCACVSIGSGSASTQSFGSLGSAFVHECADAYCPHSRYEAFCSFETAATVRTGGLGGCDNTVVTTLSDCTSADFCLATAKRPCRAAPEI